MSRAQILWTFILVIAAVAGLPCSSHAAPITWIGGNVDWNDGAGNNANWSPADEPDSDDEAIFNTPNSVNLGTANTIVGLTMSGGMDLDTNNQDLTVNGLVQLVGAGTNLFVGGSTSLLTAQNVTINNGGTVELTGGTLTMLSPATGLFDINAGGALTGHGTLNLNDGLLVATSLLTNDGTLSALSRPLVIINPPPVGTLSINAANSNARIDLDGTGENGTVNVFRNQTLDINVTLADIFNGNINLFQETTLDIAGAWTLGAGAIDVDNGATGGFPAIPAGVAHIAGGAFAQNAGTISVVDADGTLQFDSVFTQNAGTLVNNGLVVFNAAANINSANNFTMPTTSSSITVNAVVNIGDATVNAGEDFNWDGGGVTTNVTTVNAAGDLNINVENIDLGASDEYNGVVTMNSGNIDVQVADNAWVLARTLNINNTANDVPVLSGDALQVGNDSALADAHVNVGGTGISQITAPITFESDASVNVAAGAILRTSSVTFLSVNAANNAAFTGTGTWRLTGTNNISETTTINMTGGTVDLDNSSVISLFGTANDTNVDAPLTINVATMNDFGETKNNGILTTFSDLNIDNSTATGSLTVNLDDPNAEWTVNSIGIVNLINDAGTATLLAGSDVNLNGTVNVTGDVRTTARVDIAGTVNITTAAEPFRLSGGNTGADPNTLNGGTISGLGILGADTGSSLHGFGTINTSVDFDGVANLKANDGILTVNGSIVDVNVLGTADVDGILNIPAAWNTATNIASVDMLGGEIRGGTITNDNVAGITGFGLISARVINNTRLAGEHGGNLIVEAAANNNEWDGTTNTGLLIANTGDLELRDNTVFQFNGSVTARPGRIVLASGFELEFEPASTLTLASGTYRSTASTDIGGTVNVSAGADSTLANDVSQTFENGSSTTLTGSLQLDSPLTTMQVGAAFAGAGALINRPSRSLRLLSGANVGALIENQGTLELGTSIGQATALNYQQDASGHLRIDLQGVGLAQFDRLTLTGVAQLAGAVDLSLLAGFLPVLGNTFSIVSAPGGVTGTFDSLTQPAGMPAGLFFGVAYQPTFAQLVVIDHLPGDYNKNGVVDAADYIVWRNTLGQAVTALSGADGNGNGNVDAGDYAFWMARFGQTAAGSGSGTGAAIPEPATFALLILAIAAWHSRPRRLVRQRLIRT